MTLYKTYAEEFAAMLDAAYPAFGLEPAADRPELEQRRCFSMRVRCPSPAIKADLIINVSQGEIRIEFLGAHDRFSDPRFAVGQIGGLIEESRVVDTWYAGPQMRDCAFVNAQVPPRASLEMRGITRIVRRSWKGTHDTNANVA